MKLSKLVLAHFLDGQSVNLDEYTIELKQTENVKGLDVLTVDITDTVTEEVVSTQLFAVELAHLMATNPKDWKWLSKGWNSKSAKGVLDTISKTLMVNGIDLKIELSAAKVSYLGKNVVGQPIVRIEMQEGSWAQSVSIVHLPVIIKERVVEDLLDVNFEVVNPSELGQETVA